MSDNNAIIWRAELNSSSHILYLFLILISVLPTKALGGSWNIVWQEDFGVVEDSVCRDFADPNMSVPGHKVADISLMGDGYYGITNSTAWCFIHKKSVNSSKAYHFVPGRDHTGNTNGGMLVVNVGSKGNGESIYENDLKLNICGNHKYRLSMYVANVSDAPLSPDLTLLVYNVGDAANPILLESVNLSGSDVVAWPGSEKNSEGLYIHKERDWSEASLEFEAKAGDVLKIVIENNCSSGNGNDFALDDITLQRYDDEEIVPPIIEIENGITNSSCVPTYSVNNIDALSSWKNIYNSVYFLWQYSTDDGYTWTNISGESGVEKTYLQRDLPATGKEVYRLIITGGADDSEAQTKTEHIAKYGTPDDGCDYFSISNIISQMEVKDPPVAYLGIDYDQQIISQPAYDCKTIDHVVTLFSTEWDDRFSQYYILWQYSDDDKTWHDLPTLDKELLFSDDFEGLTYFRVILAANENTLAQVAKNGKSDNCDKDYFITNSVSLECKESCKKAEYEALIDKLSICQDSDDKVEWEVKQTNNAKVSEIEWYKKVEGGTIWTLIPGETGEYVSLPNPNVSTSYLFLAKNGKCVSDSIKFELTVRPPIIFDPMGDVNLCEGVGLIFTAKVTTFDLSSITYFWDGVPSTDSIYKVPNITEDRAVTLSASDGVCMSNEVVTNVTVEKKALVTLQPLPSVVCEGEKIDLVADVQLSSANSFRWEKDGNLFNDVDLVTSDILNESAIYEFIVDGVECPSLEYLILVDVEKKADVSLQPLPTIICEGEKVDLIADARLSSANTFKWEKGNELITDVDFITSDIPTEDATYKFTIIGEACPAIEKEVSVKVENNAGVTLQPLPTVICEGEKVDLIADARLTSSNKFKWEKGSELITDSDLSTSDIPNEDATYKFTITGEKCPAIEKEVSVKVEKKAEVTLKSQPSVVCVGEEVDLIADAKLTSSNTFKWEDGSGQLLSDVDQNILVIPAEDDTYKFTVFGEKCPAIEKEVSVNVEKIAEVTLQPLPAVICEGEKVDLIADAQLTSTNTFKWEKGNELVSDAELTTTDFPTEDATYKFTITGEKCPAIEKALSVKVEKKAKVTLQPLPANICEGEKVDLIADAQLSSTNTFKWEKGSELISEADLITSDMPTEDATYKFTIAGEKCPAIETELNVKVEKKADATLQPLPAVICEGEKVDLIADAKLTSSNSFKWEKEGELISDSKLTTTDIPTEDATYKFTITGDKCPVIEKEVSVKVEKKAELILSISDVLVCQNSPVSLSVISSNAPKIVWKQKSDGESQFSEMSESGDVITIAATKSATIIVESADELACQSSVSNEVSLSVEEPLAISLGNMPTEVCDGTTLQLNASITGDCPSYGWKKNDDESFGKNTLYLEDIPTETTTYEFWTKPLVCPEFSEKFVVDVEHVKDVDLIASESKICKGDDVTLTTNYPYTEGIIWESKEKGETQFNKVDESVSEIVVSPSDNTVYRVSAVSKLGCEERGSEQEIAVIQPVGLTVKDVSVCEGDVAHLEAATENSYDKIEWIFDGENSANRVGAFIDITPDSTMTYNVVAYNGICKEETSGTVNVVPIPRISSHEAIGNHIYQMIVENTDETLYFDYHNGEEKTISNLLENTVLGKFYNVEVSNSLGCSSTYQFQVPFIEPEFPIYFYQGDENWQVKNIENYPNSTLYIYDRFGKLLFKETGNTDGWSGEYSGVRLPSTDYWYILDVPEIDKEYTGHFTLMRR